MISMLPWIVCLQALPSKFSRICLNRPASPTIGKESKRAPVAPSTTEASKRTPSCGRIMSRTSNTTAAPSKGFWLKVIAPSSILRKSRTLFSTSDMCWLQRLAEDTSSTSWSTHGPASHHGERSSW